MATVGAFGATSIQTALDNTSLSFTTGGDAAWFVQSDDVHTGTTALRSGAITDDQESWVRTAVKGSGELTFCWRASSESASYDWLEVSIDGDVRAQIGGTSISSWGQESLAVSGDGVHVIKWRYRKDGSVSDGEDCGWLDAIGWTGSVPSALDFSNVTFELNGGWWWELQPMVFPGDTYGDLPWPVKTGWQFAGWYADAGLLDKLDLGAAIPSGTSRIYAKWARSVSLLDGGGIAFSSDNPYWHVELGFGFNGGNAAVIDVPNWYDSDRADYKLSLALNGPGTLSFKWKTDATSNRSLYYQEQSDSSYGASDSFYYKDPVSSSGSDGEYAGAWKVESLQLVSDGDHTVEFWAYNYDSSFQPRFSMCDFVWTPAPETIWVDFVTNGGDSLDPVGCASGDTGDMLPVPVREGYEFLGWYWDPEFRDFVDDELWPFAESLTVYAKWGRPVSELDDDTFSFWNGGTIPWHVERTAGASGGPAAVAEVPDDQRADLMTMVEGKGTLSFKWRVDPVDNVYASGYFNLSAGEERKWSPEYWYWSYGSWQEEAVMVLSDDAKEVCWALYNDSWEGNLIRYLVCDITWTPAPEKMTVAFDVDMAPNPYIATREYVPGDTFGELPTPSRPGWTFAGWHRDSPTGEAIRAEDVVPFQENIRLVARWTRPVVYMHAAGFAYSTTGEDKFQQTNVKTPGGNLAAGVTLTKASSRYWIGDDPAQYTDKPATLNATVTGPGYLSFEWAAQTPQNTSVDAICLLDGEEVADFYFSGYSTPAGGGREHVYISAGTHTLSWLAYGAPAFEYHGGCAGPDPSCYTLVASPSLFVGDIAFEKQGPQKDAQAWMEKLHDYGVFVTGDPARFKATYAARITKNGADYEARIFHALAMLAELAENADFKKFAKTFGFTVDYTRCSFSGKPKLDSKTAGVNDMVDKALSVVVPVLKNALKDLEAIPEDWSGAVVLSANEWPVDTDTCIDRGDVRYARASLEGVIATLYFMGGYDLTVNWAKGKVAADWQQPLPVVSKIPAVDDDEAWNAIAPRRVEGWGTTQDDSDALIRAAICGNTVVIRLESDLATDAESSWSDVVLRSGSTKIDRRSFASASADGRLLLEFDCSKVSNFAKKTWSLGSGWIGVSSDGALCDWEWEDDWNDDAFFQKCLIEQTKFLSKVRSATRLSTAETWMRKALVSALAADEAVMDRPDDERMHFVEYDPEDAERLEVARRNTASALYALDGVTAFDFKELHRTFGSKSRQVDLSLLPDDGWINVYLGALFEGKITRAMKPATHLNRYGEMIVEVGTLKDPTFAGLFPGMTVGKWWSVSDAFGRAEETPAVEHALVPGEQVALNCPQYIGYSVSGLPKGWKWDSKKGMLTGTASGSTFTLTFSADGMKAKETFTVGAKPKVYASIAAGEDGVGVKAVTGPKAYLANATAKVTAAIKSGYAFNGWYDAEGRMVSPNVSYSFKMPLKDVSLTAKAVSLREDGFELWSEYWIDEPVELKVGESVSTEYGRYFGYSTLSPCSISASGLPNGVKLAKVNGEYVLKGAPTKKGVYYAKLSGKNNGGFKMSAVVKFVVGGAKESFVNTAQIELERFEWGDPYTGYDYDMFIPVPARNKVGTVKSLKVSGLPSGYKYKYPVTDVIGYEELQPGEYDWNRPIKGKGLRIYGVTAKPGVYTVTVSATCTNGKTAKSQRKVVVFDSGSVYMPVLLEEGSKGRGTVSGGGVKSYGATVKLVAKSADKKKYFFAGWQKLSESWIDNPCEGEPVAQIVPFGGEWSPATYSFKLKLDYDGKDVYGRFVTKAEDLIAFDSKSYDWRVDYGIPTCGPCEDVKPAWTSCPFECMSGTKPKITAMGLPAGTKLSGSALVVSSASKLKPRHYTVKLTAENVSGNSASATVKVVVPNLTTAVDKGYLGLDTSDAGYGESTGYGDLFRAGVKTSFTLEELGVWVAEGWTLSVSGLPSGWTYKNGKVSGTATAAGPKTVTFKVTKGRSSYTATATFDLSGLPDWAVGTYVGSTLTTYKSGSFEEGTISVSVSSVGAISGKYVMGGDASVTSVSGSGFTWSDDGRLFATVSGKVDGKKKAFTLIIGDGGASFSGRISSSESIASELLVKNPWTDPNVDKGTLPTFASGVTCSFPWTGYFKGVPQAGDVSLAFSGNGKVSAKFKTNKGTVSASLQLADFSIERSEDAWSGYLIVGIPANKSKKIAGAYCYLQFSMIEDEDGLVHDIIIYDEYTPGWPLAIGFGFFNGYY